MSHPASRRVAILAYVFAAALLSACGGGSNDMAETPGPPTSASATIAPNLPPAPATTPSTSPSSIPAAKGTAVALKPSIEEALSCRVPAIKSNTDDGAPPLQKQVIDKAIFPGATCNDGSPAVLAFRPFEGEANRNKWLVALEGGGSCSNAQSCADRWCSVDTNFNADNMSSRNYGNGFHEGGILRRGADNPFANWNHVLVRYCSSDIWVGTAQAVNFTALDPKTGAEVKYQINFGGESVYEAVMATLRKEGVPALVYTRNNRRTEMPDLDSATEVVFAGGSAGGSGVINNLDRFADTLRSGKSQPPIVRGLIDSTTGPDNSKLGYATSVQCVSNGRCSYEDYFRGVAANGLNVLKRVTDQSCLDWHAKNQPGTEWQCVDSTHVLNNHITTPFFVRMGLTDELISSGDIEGGFAGADGKPFTRLTWGLATREMLLALPAAVLAGHERAAITKAPGVFAPSCEYHYTIYLNEKTYNVTVQSGGKSLTMFDAWNAWVANQKPDIVISGDPRTDKC